jgi:uncharacterized protein DUF6748
MKHRNHLAMLAVLLAPLACQQGDGDPEDVVSRDGEADIAIPTSTYYIVTAIDYRKCAFPMCGGVFVKEVNQELTLCADGSYAKSCHVAVTDYAALGLPSSTEAKLDDAWQHGGALLRGTLFQAGGPYLPTDTLAASEGWVGVTGQTPEGVFERLDDSGIVCVTFPCDSFVERILNDGFTRFIAEVDLAASGASPERLEAGYAELFATGILAVGVETWVYGPAGSAPGFAAAEFYTRVSHEETGEPCGAATCGADQVCCNPSCGVCTSPDESCLDVICPVLEEQ